MADLLTMYAGMQPDRPAVIEDGQVLFIIYDKVRELYFQDPDFGFYLLKLTSERLLQNISRLEGEVDTYKARVQALEAAAASRVT